MQAMDQNGKDPRKISASLTRRQISDFLSEQLLTLVLTVSIIAGVALGAVLKSFETKDSKWTPRHLLILTWLGDMAGNLTKIMIVPFIMASAVSATGSSKLSLTVHIISRSIPIFWLLGVTATLLGTTLTLLLQPGAHRKPPMVEDFSPERGLLVDAIMDLFRNLFPDNIISATIESFKTKLMDSPMEHNVPQRGFKRAINTSGLAVFCFAAGMAIERLEAFGRPVLAICHSIVQVTTIVHRWVVWLIPLLVVTDVSTAIVEHYVSSEEAKTSTPPTQGVLEAFDIYITIILSSSFILTFILMPSVYFLVTRKSPFKFMLNILPAILMGFGTASSTVTLPTIIYCLDRHGVNARVSRLVVLLGYSLPLSGAILLTLVSGLFGVQKENKAIRLDQLLLATLLNFSASNSVLSGYWDNVSIDPSLLGIFDPPPPDISYLLRIEWLCDRMATVVNVVSTSVVAGIMNHIYRKQIAQLPPYNQVLREGLLLKRLSVLAAGATAAVEEHEKEIVESTEVKADPSHFRKHSVKTKANDEGEGVDEATANHKNSVDTGSQGARKKGHAVRHLKKVGRVLQRKPVVRTKYKPKIASKGKTKKAKTNGDKTNSDKKVEVNEEINVTSNSGPL